MSSTGDSDGNESRESPGQADAITCEQCRSLLTAYLDGRLAPALQTSMERHLDSCPTCRVLPDGRRLDTETAGISGEIARAGSPEPSGVPERRPAPLTREHDLMLADGLRRRDPAVVKEVMALHGDRLMRSAFLLCGHNEADAKDLVQDTFVQAVKSAHCYLGRSSFYTWLHGILLNVSRNYRRKQSRMIYTDEVPETDTVRPRLPLGPTRELTPGALTQALRGLSDEHREAVILYYYNGMNASQIAGQTGVSLGTAKSRLYHAVRYLRRALQKQ